MTTGDIWAISIAAVAVFVSIVVGALNHRMARRALSLGEAQEARALQQVEADLLDAVRWRMSDGTSVLAYRITVRNAGDRSTSVVRAELKVAYETDQSRVSAVIIQPATVPASTIGGLEATQVPFSISAGSAAAVALTFRVDPGLLDGRCVRIWQVVLSDVHGTTVTIQNSLFNERL